MLVVETIAKIRRDHLVRGVPIKTIARDLRVSKNTVRKVVRGDETSYSYERKIQPMPKLGPWVDELERQLKANEKKARRDRLSLLRIHEDLASLGYEGGYDAVRRYARVWRRRHRLLSSSEAYVPLIFDPGEAYQFDWSHEYAVLSGTTTRVKAAHMRLCHSRMQLVQIFPRESQEMVFEAHERAFRFFGGVCRRGIYDNMKTAVSTVFVGKKRDYNRRFQEMCIVNYSEGSLRRLRADAVTAGGELLEPMTRIAAQARRAAEIVKNIGNFVRRGNIRTEPADINDIINTSVSLIQPEARNAGITISLDLDQGLPPVSVHVFEIEQVILNLLRNGMDALRQGDGGPLRLSVATGLDDDGMVEAAIVDTGRGLPESGIDRIFEPFFTTKQNGMGMGLAISRTIVEAHGGRLSATSNANGGSTFLFTLRRADETHTPASQAERRGGASIAAG